MGIPRRPWRLAGLAGCLALVLGLTAAGAPAAHAQQALPLPNPNGAASWGLGTGGQLGDGILASRAIPGTVNGLTSGVLQVAAGGGHALAITTGGILWAWGANDHGQLGDSTETTRSAPVQVVTGQSGFRQVAAGFDHSLALKSDGTVWAWGGDNFGQLGIGFNTTSRPTPVEVPGLTNIIQVAAGLWFSLALRSDGTVWAWGTSDALGNGSTVNSFSPVQVGIAQVTAIAAGEDAAYAIRGSGAGSTLWAWGFDGSGDLGDGMQVSHLTPEQVTGITAPGIAQVAAGNQFAVALTTDGQVWGWGTDQFGELANTPTHNLVARPIQIAASGSGITRLSAGQIHVLALTSGGGVLAWGDNSAGELGDGNNTPVVGPVRASLSGASQVAAGTNYSLAVYNQPQTLP
jgi:alpha-tubulin suppressor-like RCC1 family protein